MLNATHGYRMSTEQPKDTSPQQPQGNGDASRRAGQPKAADTRIVPQHAEAERAVLGAVLYDSSSLHQILDMVSPDDFYSTAHQLILRTMITLEDVQEEVNEVTISQQLEREGKLDQVGGLEYLVMLSEAAAAPANVRYYAALIKEKAQLRKFINAQTALTAMAHEPGAEMKGLLEQWEMTASDFLKERKETDFSPIAKVIGGTLEYLEQHAKNPSLFAGVRIGLDTIDSMTTGFKGGDYIVLAGRPSCGKTAFCLQVARYVAVNEKKSVGLFSLEMSQQALAMRLLSAEARVSGQKMRTGRLSSEDWRALVEAGNRISSSAGELLIDDTAGTNIAELKAKAKRMAQRQERLQKAKLGLIVVDYLQLLTLPEYLTKGRRAENRQQEIAEISRSLKMLAMELNVPIVVLSQLNRSIENRPDALPRLADLRESGAIEQDADIVSFISKYKAQEGENVPAYNEEEGHPVNFVIAKQRNGPTGNIVLFFNKSAQHFGEMAGVTGGDDEY